MFIKKTTVILFFFIIILSQSCATLNGKSSKPDIVSIPEETRSVESAVEDEEAHDDEFDEFLEEESFEEELAVKENKVYDPLEPFNRAMFKFNEKFYYWLLKPVAEGYMYVAPKAIRVAVRRFFSNLTTPIRLVNSALQLKFKSAGIELGRFLINTTVGVAGFMDPARKLDMYKQDEDFGQTLGYYGMGHGLFLNLPFIGPLTLRDTVGRVGDLALDPTTFFLPIEVVEKFAISAYTRINETSLNINRYDDIVKKTFDPYIFMRNAYFQNREERIKQ